MAGHAKWQNIMHRKNRQDAKRNSIFTKHSRAITAAVKEGGNESDPDKNNKLKTAIESAKADNMPKDKIQNAIKKASDKSLKEGTACKYEFYGPNGLAVIVKCITDNKNRSSSEIKAALNKFDISLGSEGSASYIFQNGFDKPTFTITLNKEDLVLFNNIKVELFRAYSVENIYTNLSK